MKVDTHNSNPRNCYRLSSIVIDLNRQVLKEDTFNSQTCRTYRVRVRPTMDVMLIECVVKGYHECGFTVSTTMKSALILPVTSAN